MRRLPPLATLLSPLLPTLAVAVMLAFVPSPAPAAVTILSADNGAGGSSTNILTLANVGFTGTDRLLVVYVGSASASALPTSVTKGSSSLTLLASVDIGVTQGTLWYLVNPSTAPETLTANWAATETSALAMSTLYLTGVHQSTPFGTPATGANGSRTAVSGQTVSGSAGDLVIDVVSWFSAGGATITPDAGVTQ